MTFLVICFAAGIALAAWRRPSPGAQRVAAWATLVGLAVILALMGARIGTSPGVLAQVGTLGLKAVVMAVGTIAGSVALVWIARPVLRRDGQDRAGTARPPEEAPGGRGSSSVPGGRGVPPRSALPVEPPTEGNPP